MTGAHVWNRVPHSALEMQSPYKRYCGVVADMSQIRVAETPAFAHIKTQRHVGVLGGKSFQVILSDRRNSPELIVYLGLLHFCCKNSNMCGVVISYQ